MERIYKLTDSESKILGSWNGFETLESVTYWFFPNKLFYMLGGANYLNKPEKFMGGLVGVWFIENGYMYSLCQSTETQLIKIFDIDPIGYSKKQMASIKIPEEIKKQLDPKTIKHKPVRMVRGLVSFNPLKEGDKTYGYFNHVEKMARRNLTGEQIANSPELVNEFFGNVPY